jgi:tetratricopeptide (TPR) repeat protein
MGSDIACGKISKFSPDRLRRSTGGTRLVKMRNRLERNHVTIKPDAAGSDPTPQEVRAALERIAASEGFRSSPQLATFLRFTVEAVLRGERERIKAYTIAVEALGRDERFDPQTDPIVRVEATRLRRAVERYYAGPGADEPVLIELRPGSYVPVFRRRAATVRRNLVLVRLRALAQPILHPLSLLAAVIAVSIAVALTISVQWQSRQEPGRAPAVARRGAEPTITALAPGNGMPVLLVDRLDLVGATDADLPALANLPANLLGKIRDAFARFDAINIASPLEAPALPNAAASAPSSIPDQRSDFQLTGSMELRPDRTASVSFRLLADSTVIWSKTFDRLATAPDWSLAEEAIVRDMAATLLQPFGVIHSHDRVKQLATGAGDPRYRCVLEASESLRSFDVEQHIRSRNCLEQLTSIDSGFASGLRYLAAIYLREHLFGVGGRPDDPAALDHALDAAGRAIQLQPESSRGYHTLSSILFSRGDIASAFAADERAVALNKFDLAALSDYGGRLVCAGEIERGMALLGAVEAGVLRQPSHQFYLFLAHYLQGELPEATQNANQITSDVFPLGLLTRGLAAAANGDRAKARDALDRLVALRPAWRDHTRAELLKFFPEPSILDRLARDLAAAGLSG